MGEQHPHGVVAQGEEFGVGGVVGPAALALARWLLEKSRYRNVFPQTSEGTKDKKTLVLEKL